jgi:Mg-chelatase subunit ChlD
VVQRVVEELQRKLANPTRQAVMGSLNRATRNRRPRHNEIDWNRTIRANLKHYQREYRTIIPETRIGYGRKRSSLRDIILCIDQSGSMGTSVVYSSIFGAVLASLRAVQTRMVVFDTSVVDLTEELHDPVDLLFGTQLGGGTDINRALSYCQGLIQRPQETILVLISDLYEGGNKTEMLKRVATLVGSGVQFISLLALNDDGAPCFDHSVAAAIAEFGVPSFACTPALFPDLMAAAINRQDIARWAAGHEIMIQAGSPTHREPSQ